MQSSKTQSMAGFASSTNPNRSMAMAGRRTAFKAFVAPDNTLRPTAAESVATSVTLGANLENLTLTGSAFIGTGTSADNVITGSAGINVLFGLVGNDKLDGGAESDAMVGGLGNDTYFVDGSDGVFENANEGIDTVNAST